MSRRTPTRDVGDDRRQLKAAAIAILLLGVATYLAFQRELPFRHHYRVHAIFTSAGNLKPGDPVRIGGLDVGRVVGTQAAPRGRARVTLRIDRSRDLLRADARLTLRPRLPFEGNDYIVLEPGSPAAPPLRDGATIAQGHTSVSVQLDQVLSVLDHPVRSALSSTVRGMSKGLGGPAGRSSGREALRRATRDLDASLLDVRRAAGAFRGARPGDLGRALRSTGELTAQLAEDPQALAGLVTDYNRVFSTLAASEAVLGDDVRALAQITRTAPPMLRRIDRALPAVERLARDARPTLAALPDALDAGTAALHQIGQIARAGELPRSLRLLRPVSADLPPLLGGLRPVASLATDLGSCVSSHVVPVLNTVLEDGPNSTGRPVWQDLVHAGTALSGGSPNFDGNGATIRLGTTESEVAMYDVLPGVGQITGAANVGGVRPVPLPSHALPPYRPDAPCAEQRLPDLTARSGGPPGNLRRLPRHTPSDSVKRMAALLGSAGGRRQLLSELLAQLREPSARRAAPAPGVTRPTREPEPKPAPATDHRGPTTILPVSPPEVGAAVSKAATAVADTLNRLLGRAPEGGG
ncbi:MAG: Long-chain-fatty-acid--CoA ligase [Conexibacter sp.]|nr:Long-chain-fatty-acid--CoA ligase [Conexibacter sp.]